MTNKSNANEPAFYEIRISGQLDEQWSAWFDQMTLTRINNGDSLITGQVIDQAALHGLLRKVRDLGLSLISVNRLQPGQLNEPDA